MGAEVHYYAIDPSAYFACFNNDLSDFKMNIFHRRVKAETATLTIRIPCGAMGFKHELHTTITRSTRISWEVCIVQCWIQSMCTPSNMFKFFYLDNFFTKYHHIKDLHRPCNMKFTYFALGVLTTSY